MKWRAWSSGRGEGALNSLPGETDYPPCDLGQVWGCQELRGPKLRIPCLEPKGAARPVNTQIGSGSLLSWAQRGWISLRDCIGNPKGESPALWETLAQMEALFPHVLILLLRDLYPREVGTSV